MTTAGAPAVSVIVPAYNVAAYLARCLQSLAKQSLQAPYEVLVVDDGSTDDSPRLVAEVTVRYPDRLRAFRKENGGHGSACNFGVAQARGEYLAFVDGDDFLAPHVLEEMLSEAQRTGADLVIGNIRSHYTDRVETYKPLPAGAAGPVLTDAERRALFRSWSTPCGRLYRRALFSYSDLRMLEGQSFGDVNFVPKTYALASRIAYVDNDWYEYERQRPDQSMHAVDRKVLDIIPALRELLTWFKRRGLFDAYRDALEYYTLSYVFTWTQRVEAVRGAPWRASLIELYGIADEHFPGWSRGRVFREVRPARLGRLKIRAARLTGFRVLGVRRVARHWLRTPL